MSMHHHTVLKLHRKHGTVAIGDCRTQLSQASVVLGPLHLSVEKLTRSCGLSSACLVGSSVASWVWLCVSWAK